MNAFFFIGIGGMGMSGLAKILHASGKLVAGSDRNLEGDFCKKILATGISIYKQDGTGLEDFLKKYNLRLSDVVVVKSTAVEDNVPDVVSARKLGIKEIMRSDLLAELFNSKKGIAIGGTSGKTTTSGLVAWLLKFSGLDPTMAIGGSITQLETNAFLGSGSHFVIEADESDGSIVKYTPQIALLTNISRDHKTIEELENLFATFANNVNRGGKAVLCADDENLMNLRKRIETPIVTYGLSEKADIHPENPMVHRDHSTFTFNGVYFTVNLPGLHNLQNALGTLAVSQILEIPVEKAAAAIHSFPGMKRRFEKIGVAKGVTVVDDFAHNPAEIAAAIEAARMNSRKRFIVYQPHGFGPTKFNREDLVKVFSSLKENESLYLDEIFYGGGTVEKDISSKQIVEDVRKKFANAFFFDDRQKIVQEVVKQAKSGDLVLVMGARDINQICHQILQFLQ